MLHGDRISFFGLSWVVLLAVFTAPSAQAAWPNTEARCDELGSTCSCSEPLSSDLVMTSSTAYDIPESVSKPCGPDGSNKALGYSGSDPKFISVSAMTGSPYNFPALPSGATVDRILVKDAGGQLALKEESFLVADKTYCHRHYFILHQTMDLDYNGGDRIKMARNTTNNGSTPEIHHETEFQYSSATFRSYETGPTSWGDWSGDGKYGGLTLYTMRGKWWRMEHCFDHLPDHRLQHRSRVVDISTGTVYENAPMVSPGTNPIFNGGDPNNWIIDGFRQKNGSKLNSGMWSGYTAGMSTLQNYNPTFWIGPAVEVEDGGGNPPPVPTKLSSPAQPAILSAAN